MPKETVQYGQQFITVEHEGTKDYPGAIIRQQYFPGDPIPAGATVDQLPSTSVHWNRDAGWVQLSIEATREWWTNWQKSYEGSTEQATFPVCTETLTRQEINNLIRTLRRARAAAYGEDA